MPTFRRVWKFCKAVAPHWGALVTGGVLIGIIGIWQGTGHPVKPGFYWAIAIAAMVIATFRVWNDQANIVETVTEEKTPKNYQKCTEVIENINCNVVDIERHAHRFVFQEAYNPNRAEAFNKINEKLRDFYSLIEKDGIFLPQNVCDTLKTFIDTLSKHVSAVGVYASIDTQQPETMKKRTEVSIEALQAFEREIPAVRKSLEHEFRKILGIETSKPQSL